MSNFLRVEVVSRGSETQHQVGEHLNYEKRSHLERKPACINLPIFWYGSCEDGSHN